MVSDDLDESGKEITAEKASYITFYLKNKNYSEDNSITNITSSHQNISKYKEAVKWINDHIKYESLSNSPKTIVYNQVIAGLKTDIVLKELNKNEAQISTYFYCEKDRVISYFVSKIKTEKGIKNIFTSIKSIDLEKIYTRQQLAIVNSFKCPPPVDTSKTKKANATK